MDKSSCGTVELGDFVSPMCTTMGWVLLAPQAGRISPGALQARDWLPDSEKVIGRPSKSENIGSKPTYYNFGVVMLKM